MTVRKPLVSINGDISELPIGDTLSSTSLDTSGITNLVHSDLAGNFRDLYRSGWTIAWFNQQWGGAQWGNLPDSLFGSVATGNIQDDTTSSGYFGDASVSMFASQGFMVSESISTPVIWIKLFKILNPTDNISVSVYSDSAGAPNAVVCAAATISGKQVTSKTDGEWYPFIVGTGTLSANTQYHVVMTRSGAADASNFYYTKVTANSKYPFGSIRIGSTSATTNIANPTSARCFLIQNPAANSLIQSGGQWGYELAFNPGTPANQSRSLVQPLANFYDGKNCTVLYRGTFVASSNVWDFTYGVDHDRITLTINASGYPVVTVYTQGGDVYTVTGTGSVSSGFHDVGIRVRTVGDGADYLTLYVDGVSVGTPLTAQTFTMDWLMPLLGTARLGDGFGIFPGWSAQLTHSGLPSTAGWTWTSTGTEANCMSVSGGKLYQNASGFSSTDYGYYSKNTTFNNTTGWTAEFTLRIPKSDNTSTSYADSGSVVFQVLDGTKRVSITICEYFLKIGDYTKVDFTIQQDFSTVDNNFVLCGKGSDYYLFINGALVVDGTSKLLTTTANNILYFGDTLATSGINADAVWGAISYYTGGALLPTATTGSCSEFAHWSGDKSDLLPYAWNSSTPISIKQLCGVNKNYIDRYNWDTIDRKGIINSPTVTGTTELISADLEVFTLGSNITAKSQGLYYNSSASGSIDTWIYVDGVRQTMSRAYVTMPGIADQISTLNNYVNLATKVGLHKVDVRWMQYGAGTGYNSNADRAMVVETKV